jgi:hypothetical protein
LNLNEIGQIKRHEKAEIKGYPSAFSEFKIGFFKEVISRQSKPVLQVFC